MKSMEDVLEEFVRTVEEAAARCERELSEILGVLGCTPDWEREARDGDGELPSEPRQARDRREQDGRAAAARTAGPVGTAGTAGTAGRRGY